ncbi:hypothetical protein GCM10027414_06430 [Humibacter ginsengiterrae]
MFGCPTETAAAAAAITIDSLGTGGKNASMSTASTITIGIHGVETTAAMKAFTASMILSPRLPPLGDITSLRDRSPHGVTLRYLKTPTRE